MADANRTTRFRFWLWQIKFIALIGAAPLARRLAAGMGSGTARARRVVCRLGQTRLAKKTGFAATERRGFLPLSAATNPGGRDVSRLAIWRANVTEESRFHRRGCVDLGPRHRRQRGALFGGQRRAAQSATFPGACTTRYAPPEQAEFRNRRYALPEFSRRAKREP